MAGGRVKVVEEPERRCPGYHRRCFALAARFFKKKANVPFKTKHSRYRAQIMDSKRET